jgi:hypothetical protein
MEPNQLSEDQKELLRLIADGLKSRRKNNGPWWIRMAHDHSMPVWQNVQNPCLWGKLQERTDLSALVVLERYGFIENAQPGRYVLAEQRILQAVERALYEDSAIS